MSSNILIPRIALFSEIEEPLDFKVFVYGTKNSLMIDADTFGDALARYLKEYNISYDMFARMTGIGKGSISRYLKNTRQIGQKYLCAVCIALRLHPLRREYLFSKSDNVIPGTYGYNGLAAHIIRNYLDGCAFSEKYTLEACNKRLIEIKAKPLTKLTSITEGSK